MIGSAYLGAFPCPYCRQRMEPTQDVGIRCPGALRFRDVYQHDGECVARVDGAHDRRAVLDQRAMVGDLKQLGWDHPVWFNVRGLPGRPRVQSTLAVLFDRHALALWALHEVEERCRA